ncbi:unnamed protein product [Arctogadus glacialis]
MSTSSPDDPIQLQNAFKKIAYLKEDIRRLSDELRRKETQLSSFSEELQRQEAMLSNYTDLAMEQSKQISTLIAATAAIQNTLHGRCSSPPRLNLANKYSVLSEVGSQTGAPEAALRPTFQADSSASSRQMTTTKAVTRRSSACVTHTAATATSHLEPRQPMHGPTVSPAKRTPAAVDPPAATTSRRSPPPPSLPAAQVGGRPASRRLQLSGPSAPPVCIGATAGGVLSPTGDSADWPVVTRADCRSQRESISARRQLLRNAVRRRPGSLPAAAICLQNPGSTSPVEPSAAAPVAAHWPTIPCASGLAGRKGVVQQQHRGPLPASPQLTPSPPSTIILEITLHGISWTGFVGYLATSRSTTNPQGRHQVN